MQRHPTTLRRQHSSFFLGSGGVRFRLVDHYHRRHDFTGVVVRLWLTCCIIGISAAVIALVVDLISSGVYELRVGLCEAVDEPVLRYVSWLGTSALAALSATLLLKVVPHAAGSGLPEVKEALMSSCSIRSPPSACSSNDRPRPPSSSPSARKARSSIARASSPFSSSTAARSPRIWCVSSGARGDHHSMCRGRRLHLWRSRGGVLFSAEISPALRHQYLPRAFFCVLSASPLCTLSCGRCCCCWADPTPSPFSPPPSRHSIASPRATWVRLRCRVRSPRSSQTSWSGRSVTHPRSVHTSAAALAG